MSSSMPSQPPKAEAYTTASNTTTRNPAENAAASSHVQQDETTARDVAQGRTPFPRSQARSADDAVPSSLGAGVRSSGPADATERENTAYVSRDAPQDGPENPNVEAEQMETLAEGKVADAVERKNGTQTAPGQEVHDDDFASGLETKKKEQQEARDAIKEARSAGVDVDGGSGQRSWREDNRDV
ncbi:hypothetical protein CH63R_03694 [Colletotrichum higginsianum IMI 349063]|uniref:Uncharacterized protein n=3 Tax=Colletotrichum higginsianum TaxID=80884 RepID=A0A1B7YHU8_COLHI|nr:hypothetical protein CH63R_03694 [Colletotrichum higginsianum IMI 349063]OBR11398.1 hypothetical protein CH63R_03694 [Colletotrichum higginsianum IMI 349063]TIC99000.1 hypothetical protein CH35J_006403 [Colletotrichum higginsianum]